MSPAIMTWKQLSTLTRWAGRPDTNVGRRLCETRRT
jgi:hypothetical protein